MRRFETATLVAIAMAATSCTQVRLSSPDGLALGAPHPLLERRAPSFATAHPLPGSSLDPKSFAGKVVIVHFWASWADASRSTLPKLQALYAKYKDRGVMFVALSVDDVAEPIPEIVAAYDVKFPVAWDARKDVVQKWYVKSVPASFVIDSQGFVRAAFVGYEDGVEVEIETDIKLLTPSIALAGK